MPSITTDAALSTSCFPVADRYGLRNYSSVAVSPTTEEQLYDEAYKIVAEDIDKLITKGFAKDELGDVDTACNSYLAIEYYYMLIDLAIYVYNYNKRNDGLDVESAEDKYKIEEVIDNLPAISIAYGGTHQKRFKAILDKFDTLNLPVESITKI